VAEAEGAPAFAGGGQFEGPLVALDGTSRWIRVSSKEVSYRGRNILVKAVSDLTREREYANRLQVTNERLRSLTAKLESVREEEKARLSRQIHDEVGQILTGIKIENTRVTAWLEELGGDATPDRVRNKLREISSLLDEALNTVRRIARELRPSLIDDLGLVAAVEWQIGSFQDRSGLPCRLRRNLSDSNLPKPVAVEVFRILQEALTNILRHAQARGVKVWLYRAGTRLVMTVQDNGKGIGQAPLDSSKSLGIIGMQERAYHVGGTLRIWGRPGKGTSVRLQIPLGEMKP
jgi:signal transduction histidine kinase